MNKKGSAKAIIISLIFVVIIALVVYVVLFRKPETGLTPTTTTITTAGTATNNAISCGSDSTCLGSNFLYCKAAEFKTDFPGPGSKYIITVFGEESGNCHYENKVLLADGTIFTGTDCKVPMNLISEDTFKHFFGQEQETAKEQQAKIATDYCTVIQ